MKRLVMAGLLAAAAIGPVRLVMAQQPGAEPPLDPQVLAWDRGPGKIDVSGYPPDIREKYRTFSELCGQCHALARAVNCNFVLEDDWERYIKRMMRRGRSLITPAQARASYEFAVFDSKVRKRELYERKLKESTPR
jgi:hypothetical protein